MSFFKETADRYESELLNSIVPFWEQHSIDSEYGGFLTCLERDGTVYDTNKYMWMQWREVYLFAVLYNSAFSQKRYLEYADNGFDFLTRSGKKPDGSYYFSLNQAGSLHRDSRRCRNFFGKFCGNRLRRTLPRDRQNLLPGRGSPMLENLLEQCRKIGTESGSSGRHAL